MRSWYPIPPESIDNIGLIREKNEIRCMSTVIWKIKNNIKGGYQHHPEVIRWLNHTPSLLMRYNSVVEEMKHRGLIDYVFDIKHPDFLDIRDVHEYPDVIEPLDVMKEKLNNKMKSRQNHKL